MAEEDTYVLFTQILADVYLRLNAIGASIIAEANRAIWTLSDLIDKVLAGVRDVISEVQGLAGTLWDTIKGMIDAATGWINDLYERIMDSLWRIVREIGDWIGNLTLDVFDAIKTVAQKIFAGIMAAIEWIGEQAREIIKWVGERIENIGDWIKDSLNTVVNSVWDWIRGIPAWINSVIQAVREWLGKIIVPIKDIVNRIFEWVGDVADDFFIVARMLFDKIIDFLMKEYTEEELIAIIGDAVAPILKLQQIVSESFGRAALKV